MENKKFAVFDIESDGLLDTVSKVFCISILDIQTGEQELFTPDRVLDALNRLKEFDVLVGHNIIAYDIPSLKKVYNFKFEGSLMDTLILSRLRYPFLQSHSLDAWGERLGFPKIKYDNFSFYELEMGEYCNNDVLLNYKLYKHLTKRMNIDSRYVELEMETARVQSKAELFGVNFDMDSAMKLFMQINNEMNTIKSEVEFMLGYTYEVCEHKTKKDGSLSHHAQKLLFVTNQEFEQEISEGILQEVKAELRLEGDLLKSFIKVPIKVTLDTKDYLTNFLLEAGWEPTMFTETGKPKITDKGEVCPNLLEMDSAYANVGKYFILKHRKALVEGLMKVAQKRAVSGANKPTTYFIPSEANTLGAVTGRYTHRKIANLPSHESLYGPDIRALFGVESGRVMIGSDLAGIEARMLAHYMNDPAYTLAVTDGDIHTTNQEAAGLPTRKAAKGFFYGFLYGAGDAKVGSLVNGTAEDGKAIKEKFLSNLPSLAELIKRKQKEAERGYITSLDGRPVMMTSSERFGMKVYDTRKALNSLLQSSATIFFKKWATTINRKFEEENLDAVIMILYHDEVQISSSKKDSERVKVILREALLETDKYYEVNCRNDIDIKQGTNWADCH